MGARRPRVDWGSRGAPERRAGGADQSERRDGSVKDGPGKNRRDPSGECRARRAQEGPPTAPLPLVFSYSPPFNDSPRENATPSVLVIVKHLETPVYKLPALLVRCQLFPRGHVFSASHSLFRQGPRHAREHAESPMKGATAIIMRGQLLASNGPAFAVSSRAVFARLGGRERSSPQRRCSERQWFVFVGSA